MSVAAPSSLLLRRRSTLEPLALDASLAIGAGGEARVFSVPGDRGLVAKIYHEPTVERARKVALMVEEPPRIDDPRAALAWPVDLLLGEGGRFAGFLMPRAEGPRLFELYNPITRRRSGALCDPAMLHRAGAHVAAAFDALHERGYVIGDVNESNVLLKPDGVVTLVDTDSFQVRDPEDGTIHRSKVGKAEFTPPELQGRTFADFDRTPEHDRFGLGVLLFLALMEGTHPFAGRMETRAETPPVEERIRRGLFPHHGHPEIHPPRLAPPFAVLDPEIRTLFIRCFADGHGDPSARPAAAEWRTALAAAEARLGTCGANPRHRFGAHLGACPWCERTRLLHGRDPFPAAPTKTARPPVPAKRIAAPPRAVATRPAAPPAPRPAAVPKLPAVSKSHDDELLERLKGASIITALLAVVAVLSGVLPFVVAGGMTLAGIAALWMALADDRKPAPRTLRRKPVPPALPRKAAPSAPPVLPPKPAPPALPRKPAPPAAPTLPPSPLGPSDDRYVRRLLRAGVPRTAIISPRPNPQRKWRAYVTYRVRFGTPRAEDVDHPPRMVNSADLEHRLKGCVPPSGMHPPNWTIRIALQVGENGRTSSVRVVGRKSGGVISRAVVDAVSQARFHPMTRGGIRVAAWVWFDVTFEQS